MIYQGDPMKRTLVAVADLGRFKAFELLKRHGDSKAHLELLEKVEPPRGRKNLSELLTDNAGRFPRVSGPKDVRYPGMSIGDRHDLKLEHDRRAMQTVADELNSLLAGDEFETCWLAANKQIYPSLVGSLRPAARAKIKRSLHLDLTKLHPEDVLVHFEPTNGRNEARVPESRARTGRGTRYKPVQQGKTQ
jgi:hypothetical protein